MKKIKVKLHNQGIYLSADVTEDQILNVFLHPDSGYGLPVQHDSVIARSVYDLEDIDVRFTLKRFITNIEDMSNLLAYDNGETKTVFILHSGTNIRTFFSESYKESKKLIELFNPNKRSEIVDLWFISFKG